MKKYLEWGEVKAGDWLEAPSGELLVVGPVEGIAGHPMGPSVHTNCGIFATGDLKTLGIKPFRKEPLKVEFEAEVTNTSGDPWILGTHEELDPLRGKRVRVTVEEIPE